jgi:hypothetical protein
MWSIEKHQDIPKGEAAVMPVGEPWKWCRVCNFDAERRQKRKESTQGNRGSRRKLAATHRKMSYRAKVAWRKRKLVKKIWIQENCELWKELAVARREMTHHAKVARHKGFRWCEHATKAERERRT